MHTMRPSPAWEVLLEPFQSLFTQPGFRYFRVFVFVFAPLDGRLWVTQVLLANLLERHFTNFYRFLGSPAFSPEAVARKVFGLCLAYCVQEGNRLLIAVDDTVAKKWGQHFESLGVHHDPMNRAHPKRLSHGHCFVCLAALGQQTTGHFVALFLCCALYVQKSACKATRAFATKLTLAASLFVQLPLPPEIVLIAVGDGA
jgi:hypothetical protein